MSNRKLFRVAIPALGAVVATTALVGTAAAGSSDKVTKRETLDVVGGVKFKANRFVTDDMRWGDDVVAIKSGGTLTIRNRTKEPHSLSVVKKNQLPRTMKALDGCFEGGVCLDIAKSHGSDGESEPTIPLVDVGGKGFNQAGDSVFFAGKSQKITVSGRKGSTLSFLCALHPWMQAKIEVE